MDTPHSEQRSLSDPTCNDDECRDRWTVQITFVTGEMYRGCEKHARSVVRMVDASRGSDWPIPDVRDIVRLGEEAPALHSHPPENPAGEGIGNTVPNALVLTPSEVPRGFRLRESDDDPIKAHRMYGKGRFMNFGDAIWSEAALMRDDLTAHSAWTALVELHKQRKDYDDVQELPMALGDASYVHTGTMRGRPGLWAAVRIGLVIHRFNTYGVGEAESLDMLRRQLSKT